jgi:hypothetical protein
MSALPFSVTYAASHPSPMCFLSKGYVSLSSCIKQSFQLKNKKKQYTHNIPTIMHTIHRHTKEALTHLPVPSSEFLFLLSPIFFMRMQTHKSILMFSSPCAIIMFYIYQLFDTLLYVCYHLSPTTDTEHINTGQTPHNT